ncbi:MULTISPECIES: DUF4167 domain-containing protein [Sphingomonas]|uniref:DUF4167 domain-containing protein n=1 Tax=Sphingomonas kyungheensis TaxID=1069987 RepID=A0ABU8H4J3_9SPHN|nr:MULTISPECIES: DUF4167 domain-containing protein [unclassified Sphingomonas]EZP49338.1 hypothetical protein BW41_03620 [Sphingomonas sp. RIT328]
MINNRQQNGRRRGRGGNNGGNNGPRQGGQGRPDNGNRIDSRARGNANQLFEKYKNLAGEAQRQGDRVNTEYYLQFADHYFRVIADQRGRFEDNQPKRQQPFDLNDDDDYGDEGEPIRAGDQDGEQGQREQNQRDQGRNDQGQREARGERQPRQWEDRGNRDERAQPQREERAARDDRPQREDRTRRPRFESETPVEVAGQRRADPLAEGEDLQQRTEAVLEADSPVLAPRPRRGRPRRDAQPEAEATAAPAEAAPVAESNGVDADRLPPSLNIAAANDGEEAPKPRRRRVRAPAVDAPAAE